MRRALLGRGIAPALVVSGFFLAGIDARKRSERASVLKPGNVANLGNELGPERPASARRSGPS